MASFERQCRRCDGDGYLKSEEDLPHKGRCPECDGEGVVLRPISVPVRIRIDNRAPAPFVMTITPGGVLEFRGKRKRHSIKTTVQAAFNRAMAELTAETLQATRDKRRKKLMAGINRRRTR